MKKIIICFFICLFSLTVHAEGRFSNCYPFTAVNGKRFCYPSPNKGITWLAAIAWCDAQGLRLAAPNELCDIDTVPWNRMRDKSNGCKNIVINGERVEGLENHLYWLRGLNSDGNGAIVQSEITVNVPAWYRTPLCAMD